METNSFFAYAWHIDPKEERVTSKRIYGLSSDKNNICKNVCLRIDNFTPFVYIELPDDVVWTNSKAQLVGNKIDSLLSQDSRPITKSFIMKKRLYYAHIDSTNKRIKFPYLFLSFSSQKDIKTLSYKIRKSLTIAGVGHIQLKMHEQDASPILQFTCMRNIPTAGWIKFTGTKVLGDDKLTLCEYEYKVKWKNVSPMESNIIPLPKILAFDLEVNSTNPRAMPQAHKTGDKIFQISCILAREGDDEKNYDNYLLTLGEPDQKTTGENVNILTFKTEAELLIGFTGFVRKHNPNVICGYNILNFDVPYMIARSKLNMCIQEFDVLGFPKYAHAKEEEIKWSSSAYKNQTFKYLDAEGRLFVDLLPLIKRDYKFSNYKLKTVSTHFLGVTKDPLSVQGIFKCYRIGMKGGTKGAKALGVVGKYCIQDSVLCLKLFRVLQIWIGLCEMAKTCCVPMFVLYTQGQQVKVYSQVYKSCMYSGYVVEKDGYIPDADEHYKGATVFEPITGVHDKVVPFDFCSLYPTSIIAYNICWSTLVKDDKIPDRHCHVMEWDDHIGCQHDPKIVRKVELTKYIDTIKEDVKKIRDHKNKSLCKITKIKYKEKIDKILLDLKPYIKERGELSKCKPKHIMCSHRKYRFLKEPKGVLPTILQNLLDARAHTRKQIAVFKDILKGAMKKLELVSELIPKIIKKIENKEQLSDIDKNDIKSLISVLDKRQLAYKVSANSMYGAMGVVRGYLPFMPGAMATTYIGRISIEKVAKIIPEKFGGKLIYGDTDSAYVVFPDKNTAEEVWDWSEHVSVEVSKEFPPPMELAFEKIIYWRFLILTKKRYMSLPCYRDGIVKKEIEKKGVLLARRDNSEIIRDIYTDVTMKIFNKIPKDTILNELVEHINNLCSSTTEYKKFIVTKAVGDHGDINIIPFIDEKDGKKKGLSGSYKVTLLSNEIKERDRQLKLKNCDTPREYYLRCLPAVVQLAEKMRQRGMRVDAGTRLEYVITSDHGLNAKQYMKIEDYDYFNKHSEVLNIDFMYYLGILANSMDQVLNCCYFNKDDGQKYKFKQDFCLQQHKLRINRAKLLQQLTDLHKPKLNFTEK
jgi:DNA polymerase elongation subunit (family B)